MIKNDGALRCQAQGLGLIAMNWAVGASGAVGTVTCPGGAASVATSDSGATYVVTLASGFRPSTIVSAFITHEHDALGSKAADVTIGVDIDSYDSAAGTFTCRVLRDANSDGSYTDDGQLASGVQVSLLIVGIFDSAAV